MIIKKNNGFILLETLLALSLLGIILVLSIQSVAGLLRLLGDSDRWCSAAALTQTALAAVRRQESVREDPPATVPGFETRTEKSTLNAHLDRCTIIVSWDGGDRAEAVTYAARSGRPREPGE